MRKGNSGYYRMVRSIHDEIIGFMTLKLELKLFNDIRFERNSNVCL